MFIKFAFIFKIMLTFWLFFKVDRYDATIMKFTNFVCENMNNSIIQINQCRLKAVRRNVITLNFNATLHQPIQNMDVEAEIFQKANGYKPWLYKINIDACKFIRKAYNPIAILMVGDVLKFTNVNHSCPYEGNLIVQGFYLKPEMMTLPLPTGDYMVYARWSFNKKLGVIAKYYFTFVENLLKSGK